MSLLCKELLEIVEFIKEKSGKLKISQWTNEQIAVYVGEKISKKECIVIYSSSEPSKPEGVIFFRQTETEIYIEQIWCKNREILKKFLAILTTCFPWVLTIKAYHQIRKREINFNVGQFIRIYG